MGSRLARSFGAALLAVLVAAGTAAAVDVYDTTATLGWEPASGPVAGYYVAVSRNGAAASVEAVTSDPSHILEGQPGDELIVQVAAFDAEGVAGPLSEASDPIRFLQASSDTTADSTTDSGDGSGGSSTVDGGSTSDGSTDAGDTTPTPASVWAPRDFDCDGTSDLLVRNGDGGLEIWTLETGDVSAAFALPPVPSNYALASVADYDGDGCADLLWQHRKSDALLVWRNVLSGLVEEELGSPRGRHWARARTADLDANGTDDLVLYNLKNGSVELWMMVAGQVAQTVSVQGDRSSWTLAAAFDGDGDGEAELLWEQVDSREVELVDLELAGAVRLGQMLAGWEAIASGDLDGDGTEEILMQDAAHGAVASVDVDVSGVSHWTDLPSSIGLGQTVGTGDYDGDGRDDVAWYDPTHGLLTLWLAGGEIEVQRTTGLDSAARLLYRE